MVNHQIPIETCWKSHGKASDFYTKINNGRPLAFQKLVHQQYVVGTSSMLEHEANKQKIEKGSQCKPGKCNPN